MTDEMLTRYALGLLSEEEQEKVESRIFADRDTFERLLAVEDELIDSYASGRMGPDHRSRFEMYLLQTDADRERVAFSRELTGYVTKASQPAASGGGHRWWVRWFEFRLKSPWVLVPLAASLFLLIGGVWLAVQTIRLNNQLEQMQAAQDARERKERELEGQIAEERRRSEELSQQLELERQQPEGQAQRTPATSAPSLVSFILMPGGVRGGGGENKLNLRREAERIRLHVRYKTVSDYQSYRIELQTVDGKVLWQGSAGRPGRIGDYRSVAVTVPAKLFGEDDYILVLKAIDQSGREETVGEYFLRVAQGG